MPESAVAKLVKYYDVTGAADSRSFVYLLSHLSLHAIVLQIYWSRVVFSRTPPMPMHGSFSCVGDGLRELEKCARMRDDVVLKVKRSGKRKWIFPP